MRRFHWVLYAVTGFCLLTLCGFALFSRRTPTPPAATTSPTTDSPSLTSGDPIAYVGVWNGRLAVFSLQSTSPIEVYDVFISSLPESEQAVLRIGVPVYSDLELRRLLEDYTG